jgi:hypothetical protein
MFCLNQIEFNGFKITPFSFRSYPIIQNSKRHWLRTLEVWAVVTVSEVPLRRDVLLTCAASGWSSTEPDILYGVE